MLRWGSVIDNWNGENNILGWATLNYSLVETKGIILVARGQEHAAYWKPSAQMRVKIVRLGIAVHFHYTFRLPNSNQPVRQTPYNAAEMPSLESYIVVHSYLFCKTVSWYDPMIFRRGGDRTIQPEEIRRHQELQTQLRWYFHVRYTCSFFVLLVVVEILGHLAQDDAIDIFQSTNTCPRFREATYRVLVRRKLCN